MTPSNTRPLTAKEKVKAEFARRIQHFMNLKGWNQTELSRNAKQFTPEGAPGVSRDLISKYVGARTFPGQVNLKILADTLGCTTSDLLTVATPDATERNLGPVLEVADQGDGTVRLHVNQAVEWSKALKILAILKGED